MKKSKLGLLQECDIIADLLPIYLDGATQKETNHLIEEHLAGCESCRQNYKWMGNSLSEVLHQEKSGKKPKKQKRRKMFRKVKWKLFLYGYVCLLIAIWLYCVLDFMYFF